jgi:hypothetical protein
MSVIFTIKFPQMGIYFPICVHLIVLFYYFSKYPKWHKLCL